MSFPLMMRMRKQRTRKVNPRRKSPKRTAPAPKARSRIQMLLHRPGTAMRAFLIHTSRLSHYGIMCIIMKFCEQHKYLFIRVNSKMNS